MLSDISQLQKDILYDSIYEVPGVVRFIEIESRMIVTGGWRRGDEELVGIKLQLGKMKKFQRWLHNNVNILNATELYS